MITGVTGAIDSQQESLEGGWHPGGNSPWKVKIDKIMRHAVKHEEDEAVINPYCRLVVEY